MSHIATTKPVRLPGPLVLSYMHNVGHLLDSSSPKSAFFVNMARHNIKLPLLLRLQILLIFLLSHLTTCLPTNPADNLTVPVPPTSNDTLTSPVASCATLPDWPEWFQPSEKFDSLDVERTLDLFYNDYVRDHGDTIYEFLRSGVTPVRQIPTQRLPLKVAYGMAKDTPPGKD